MRGSVRPRRGRRGIDGILVALFASGCGCISSAPPTALEVTLAADSTHSLGWVDVPTVAAPPTRLPVRRTDASEAVRDAIAEGRFVLVHPRASWLVEDVELTRDLDRDSPIRRALAGFVVIEVDLAEDRARSIAALAPPGLHAPLPPIDALEPGRVLLWDPRTGRVSRAFIEQERAGLIRAIEGFAHATERDAP